VSGRDRHSRTRWGEEVLAADLAMQVAQGRDARSGTDSAEHVLVQLMTRSSVGELLLDAGATRVVLANPAAGELLGRRPGDLIGCTLVELFGDAAEPIAAGAADAPVEPARPDGARRRLACTVRHLRLFGRQTPRITLFDMTAEVERAESLRRQAAVFDVIRDGVVIVDADQRVEQVNRAFERITGYAAEEAVGRTPRLFTAQCDDPALGERVDESLREEGRWEGEIWNRRRSGECYPQWLAIHALRDDRGRIEGHVGVFSDITRIKRTQAELERVTHYDPLTGLPNRALLIERLEHAIERARRRGTLGTVLLCNLDHLKIVNDSLGLVAGDEVLKTMARRIAGRVRGEDTLARIGADDFVIVLETVGDGHDAARVARDILSLAKEPVRLSDGQEIFVGISVGITVFPSDGEDAHALIRCADTAMHRAKHEGRGVYRFYTQQMTAVARERLMLETHLRRALERREFEVHFQPRLSLTTGALLGAEALARWRHPTEGLIMPDRFIPLAEETGLILPLGEWALREACSALRSWHDAGLPALSVSVNVSARQFRDARLAERVEAALADTGADPCHLELEITESELLDYGANAEATLARLRTLGLKLAIDDFGTGYSSLAYLKRFAVDRLKIDRTFVHDLPDDPDGVQIVDAVIAMAHRLDMTVVAEGVETHAQLDFLAERGCDSYQGFFASPALPLAEFHAYCDALYGV